MLVIFLFFFFLGARDLSQTHSTLSPSDSDELTSLLGPQVAWDPGPANQSPVFSLALGTGQEVGMGLAQPIVSLWLHWFQDGHGLSSPSNWFWHLGFFGDFLLGEEKRQNIYLELGFPGGRVVKNLPANAGDLRDADSVPGSGRSPGGGRGNSLLYSCLESPMDRGAWQATVHGVAESRIWLKWLRTHTHPRAAGDHLLPWGLGPGKEPKWRKAELCMEPKAESWGQPLIPWIQPCLKLHFTLDFSVLFAKFPPLPFFVVVNLRVAWGGFSVTCSWKYLFPWLK